MGRIQMNFIHLLSSEAVQHITVHCLNTPVWAAGPDLAPSAGAVSFKAWTGEEIRAGDLLEPLTPRDDCWVGAEHLKLRAKEHGLEAASNNKALFDLPQIKDGRWHRTHFVFQAQDPHLLPIVDVYNLPSTEAGARYHIEVGPVCFL